MNLRSDKRRNIQRELDFSFAAPGEAQEIRGPDGGAIHFDIDPFLKRCLMEGLDDIGLTLEKADAIAAFEAEVKTSRPWL